MEKIDSQKISAFVLVAVLIFLSFLLLRPILVSLISGILLGFVFLPVYRRINKRIKNRNLSASIVCAIVILCIGVPIWFLTPVLLNQSIHIFLSLQKMDILTPLKNLFPSIFSLPGISYEFATVSSSFVSNLTSGAMNAISHFLLSFPTTFLKFLVVLFVFFFILRDNGEFVSYIQSILPFPKNVEKKLFKSSKDITFSILYGQIIVGVLQGIFMGIGFYVAGVPNALLLGVLATLVGIIPIIGPAVVWIPVAIYLLLTGAIVPAIVVVVFGFLNVLFENTVKPMIVSKRSNVHPGIILLGMIGGVLFFGLIGFILGPLILSYLLILIELYRDKRVPGIFIQQGTD